MTDRLSYKKIFGASKAQTASELAKRNDVSIEKITGVIRMGTHDEMMTTNSRIDARRNAIDHIKRDGIDYYSQRRVSLKKMSKPMKNQKAPQPPKPAVTAREIGESILDRIAAVLDEAKADRYNRKTMRLRKGGAEKISAYLNYAGRHRDRLKKNIGSLGAGMTDAERIRAASANQNKSESLLGRIEAVCEIDALKHKDKLDAKYPVDDRGHRPTGPKQKQVNRVSNKLSKRIVGKWLTAPSRGYPSERPDESLLARISDAIDEASDHPLRPKHWQMSAPGTGAHNQNHHGYSNRTEHGEYHIWPPNKRRGGYSLKFANTGGGPNGKGQHPKTGTGLWHDLGNNHRSPNAAMRAARAHHDSASAPSAKSESVLDRISEFVGSGAVGGFVGGVVGATAASPVAPAEKPDEVSMRIRIMQKPKRLRNSESPTGMASFDQKGS